MLRQSNTPVKGSSPMKVGLSKIKGDSICKYKTRTCSQAALEDYDYCIKHILEDKNAPYRPCSFVYPTNNKCFMAALKPDKTENGYCPLHLYKTQVKSQRKSSKYVPPTTPEFLLSGLSHYLRPSRSIPKDDCKYSSKTKSINPFVEGDANKAAQGKLHVLECASESDSDVEPTTLDSIWPALNEDSSDAESIDSQLDDSLKHSGYYTAEEVLAISRNKLMRLQLLYQKQFDRLQFVYRERKRHYLQALKKEKETLSSIYNQAKTSAKERKLYDKLKALNRYHKRSSAESLAFLSSLEKRAKEIRGVNFKPLGPSTRCLFSEGGVRCSKIVLPHAKFCLQHILEDKSQCLFKPCGCLKADSNCQVPVTTVGSQETCIIHMRLSVLPHSSYPVSVTQMDCEKKSTDESEIDASATESAFSTDQRDSPENSIIQNEDLDEKKDVTELLKYSDTPMDALKEEDMKDNIQEPSQSLAL